MGAPGHQARKAKRTAQQAAESGPVKTLGRVGLIAYGIIGLLLVYSAVTYDPEKATGMDTALKTLAGQPYGTALLLIVAAGLACFGAYCLFDARYRRG
jgi:hypothetical protein